MIFNIILKILFFDFIFEVWIIIPETIAAKGVGLCKNIFIFVK